MKTVRLYDDENKLIDEQECETVDECNSLIAAMLSIAHDENGTVDVEDDDGRIWSPV